MVLTAMCELSNVGLRLRIYANLTHTGMRTPQEGWTEQQFQPERFFACKFQILEGNRADDMAQSELSSTDKRANTDIYILKTQCVCASWQQVKSAVAKINFSTGNSYEIFNSREQYICVHMTTFLSEEAEISSKGKGIERGGRVYSCFNGSLLAVIPWRAPAQG